MLFDGAIRFARQSQDFMAAGNLEENAKLIRAQDIVNELMLSLDHDAENWPATWRGCIYTFMIF